VHVAADAWRRLPEDDDDLVAVAATYYRHPAPLPLPGSQAAIRELPRLFPPGRAVLPAPTYGEYAPAWRAAGHRVDEVAPARIDEFAEGADVLMLCNPNNPTAARFSTSRLLALAAQLEAHGGWLVVDEAFADAEPAHSLTAHAGFAARNLIVLRSLGKFFGLAGARVGFCCADPAFNARLAERLGPWALAHPSRVAAMQALGDVAWQREQSLRLATANARLKTLLARHGLDSVAGGNLFRYAASGAAGHWHEHLARRGILVRRLTQPDALRFGLPGAESEWQRVERAFIDWSEA
jgi:cobalamin biosynthetic protein CobC